MQLDHLAFQAPDIEAAVSWLGSVIPDARTVYQDPTWALLEAGGARIAIVTPDRHPPHVGFRVDPATLEKVAAERGVRAAPHRDGSRSIYLHGPGTICLELVAYPGPSQAG